MQLYRQLKNRKLQKYISNKIIHHALHDIPKLNKTTATIVTAPNPLISLSKFHIFGTSAKTICWRPTRYIEKGGSSLLTLMIGYLAFGVASCANDVAAVGDSASFENSRHSNAFSYMIRTPHLTFIISRDLPRLTMSVPVLIEIR